MRRKRRKAEAAKAAAAELMQRQEFEEDRFRAIRAFDEAVDRYVEMVRTGSCPSCEGLVTWEEAPTESIPEALRAFGDLQMDGGLRFEARHAKDCTAYAQWLNLPTLATMYGIAANNAKEMVKRADGEYWAVRRPIRVPALGDPPVAG